MSSSRIPLEGRARSDQVDPSAEGKVSLALKASRTNSTNSRGEVDAALPLETFLMNSKECLVASKAVAKGSRCRPKAKTL